MAGSVKTAAQEEPRIANIRLQTSINGLTIPVVVGRTRIATNLIYYADFKSIKQTERQETGKGGSPPSRTYYTYSASVIMALSDSPIYLIPRVWKGKEEFAETGPVPQQITRNAGITTIPAGGVVPVPLNAGETLVRVERVTITHVTDVQHGDNPEYTSTFEAVPGTDWTLSATQFTFQPHLVGKQLSYTYTVQTTTPAQSALAKLGLGLKTGARDQPPWSYLTAAHPTQALGYSGISYVYGRDYGLSNYAEVENHSFEVVGPFGTSAAYPDCNPADVLLYMFTDPLCGMGMSLGFLWDMTQYANFCKAAKMLISHAFTQQRPGREWIKDILEATSTDACWTGRHLRLVPRYENSLSSDLGSYTPNLTPVAEITIDDLLEAGGDGPPIKVDRMDDQDVPNIYRAEYSNRASAYNVDVVSVEDEASIVLTGARVDAQKSWLFFCDGASAQWALEMHKHFRRSVRNRYIFKLPFRFDALELGDLLTLTYAPLNLAQWPVMIEKITDGEDSSTEIVARDFPAGSTNVPTMEPQLNAGFRHDYNVAPGPISAVHLFEPPGGFTSTGLEVWLAVASDSPLFGGCDVHASLDNGESYRLVSTLQQSSRMGVLRKRLGEGVGSSFEVRMLGKGKLYSVSAYDADARQTLCLIGGNDPMSQEFVGYETAQLVAPNVYFLNQLRRAWYGTSDQEHPAGVPFVFVDDGLATSGALDRSIIGKTIRFKLLPFNVFGGGRPNLDSVPEYLYKVTGAFVNQGDRRIFAPNLLSNPAFSAGLVQWIAQVGTTGDFGIEVDKSVGTGIDSNVMRAARISQLKLNAVGNAYLLSEARVSVEEGDTYVAQAKAIQFRSQRAGLVLTFSDASDAILKEYTQDFEDRMKLSKGALVQPGRNRLDSMAAKRLWGPASFFVDGNESLPLRTVSGAKKIASVRFRSTSDGPIGLVGAWFDTSAGNAAGSPQIKMTIYDDDGSLAHYPNWNSPRWSATQSISLGGSATYQQVTGDALASPGVREGALYHLVFENVSSDPDANWCSLKTSWNADSSLGPSEFIAMLEMSVLTGETAGALSASTWTDRAVAYNGARRLLPNFSVHVTGATYNLGVNRMTSGNLPVERHRIVTNATPIREAITTTQVRGLDGFSIYAATTTGGFLDWELSQVVGGVTSVIQAGTIEQPDANMRYGNDGEGVFKRYDTAVDSLGVTLNPSVSVYYLKFTPRGTSQWVCAMIDTFADVLWNEWNFGDGRGEQFISGTWYVADPTNQFNTNYALKSYHLPLVFHEKRIGLEFVNPKLPSTYDQYSIRAVAPPGAVSARVGVFMEGAPFNNGDLAELWAYQPGLAHVDATFEGIPPWNGGHMNGVTADQIEKGGLGSAKEGRNLITYPDGIAAPGVEVVLSKPARVTLNWSAVGKTTPRRSVGITPPLDLTVESGGNVWVERLSPSGNIAYPSRAATAKQRWTGSTTDQVQATTAADTNVIDLPAGTYQFRLRYEQTFTSPNQSNNGATFVATFGLGDASIIARIDYT